MSYGSWVFYLSADENVFGVTKKFGMVAADHFELFHKQHGLVLGKVLLKKKKILIWILSCSPWKQQSFSIDCSDLHLNAYWQYVVLTVYINYPWEKREKKKKLPKIKY